MAKHRGRIITNFDERRPLLSNAPLSYQRLIEKSYDRTVIETLHLNGQLVADRINRVEEIMSVSVTLGDGTTIHGDIVVANSIKDSFNRIETSQAPEKLKEKLQLLSSQVGSLVEKLDAEGAKKAADDLVVLTKEALRRNPRREWWELSVKGLTEAAKSVRDVGVPIIQTLAVVAKLLFPPS